MRTPTLSLAAWFSLLAVAASCSAPTNGRTLVDEEPTARATRIELKDGRSYRGAIAAAEIVVAEGSSIFADGDLTLHATEVLEVHGSLRAFDAPSSDHANAPDLALVSDDRLTVTGDVIGSNGWSWAGTPAEDRPPVPGGDGSDVLLRAPDVAILGTIRAGNGGEGGEGAPGGAGGSTKVIGHQTSWRHCRTDGEQVDDPNRGVFAGRGGKGGTPSRLTGAAGAGGLGGSTGYEPYSAATQ